MAAANQPSPPLPATPAVSQRSIDKSHLHRNPNPACFPAKSASTPAQVSSSCPMTIAPSAPTLPSSPRPVRTFHTLLHPLLVTSCPVAHRTLPQIPSLSPSSAAPTELFSQEIQADLDASLTSPQTKKTRRNTSHLPPAIYHIAAGGPPNQAKKNPQTPRTRFLPHPLSPHGPPNPFSTHFPGSWPSTHGFLAVRTAHRDRLCHPHHRNPTKSLKPPHPLDLLPPLHPIGRSTNPLGRAATGFLWPPTHRAIGAFPVGRKPKGIGGSATAGCTPAPPLYGGWVRPPSRS
jgi:hypothetical protein